MARMASPVLTGYFAIAFGDQYLSCRYDSKKFKTILRPRETDPWSPFSRFVAEPSELHKGYTNIWCIYNRKYWVPRKLHDVAYIYCDAKEPQEDPAPSCTLFRIEEGERSGQIRIKHLGQSGTVERVTTIWVRSTSKDTPDEVPRLHIMDDNYRFDQIFEVVRLDESRRLPKYVRFKGDNDEYLGTADGNRLRFAWKDAGERNVIHSVHHNVEGTAVRVRAESVGKYWKLGDEDWVFATGDDNETAGTWFEPVRLGGNTIALKCRDNGKFVKRLIGGGVVDGLKAWANSLVVYAQLRLEEAVVARKIYNVEYDFVAAKVNDEKALTMATTHSINEGSTDNKAKLNLKYSVATTRSWNTTTTESWGVKASIHAGLPKLFSFGLELKVDLEGHYDHSYEQGSEESHTSVEEKSVDYDVTVPPDTRLTLHAIAKQASCDIPYSYYQKDILTNGDTVFTKMEDGLFQGVNSYEFTYKVSEQKLPADVAQQPQDNDDELPADVAQQPQDNDESRKKKRKQGQLLDA